MSAADSKTLFIEPFAGMAGDMFLAALLDLKDERFTLADLREFADALVPGEARLVVDTAWRGSLSGLQLDVQTPESEKSPHRYYKDCVAVIERAPMSAEAKVKACAVMWRIAVAEARVHGTTPEQIHFHEVGAVDSLIDIAGAAFALERLGVERVLATPPLVGSGTVKCAHGEMPVPVPATAELLRRTPHVLGGGGERLTPTGAALLLEFVEKFEAPRDFVTHSIGYGAGHRDPQTGPPNILRVQLGREVAAGARQAVAQLVECNLDDMTGEEIGFLVQQLRAAGALEAWTAPVQMKKDRPGVVVSALCRAQQREALERVLFEHSTTLGVRWTTCERTECARETFEVDVHGQEVRIQRRSRPGATADLARDLAAEYDDLARLAAALGISLREAERLALDAARKSKR
jgi:uncharacterized protein (TIGR00299 family) protein